MQNVLLLVMNDIQPCNQPMHRAEAVCAHAGPRPRCGTFFAVWAHRAAQQRSKSAGMHTGMLCHHSHAFHGLRLDDMSKTDKDHACRPSRAEAQSAVLSARSLTVTLHLQTVYMP
jgi:hypothetical protein